MGVFSERQPFVAIATLAVVILNNALASFLFFAVYGFDIGTFADRGALVDRGPGVAELLRLAALIDMVGYLALAPAVIYLHGRFEADASGRPVQRWVVGVLTFCGLGFVLVGAIGAVLIASVGPTLLQAAGGGPAVEAAARLTFAALATSVYVGLWGTLELMLYGAWLIGVGWLVRAEGRGFAWFAAVGGLGALGYSLRTGLTGRTPVEGIGPLDALILGALGVAQAWVVWLSVRLWLGR